MNMSFSKTTAQVRNRTKTVTRRRGWRKLKPGQVFTAIEKGQGLKKGEKVVKLDSCRCLSNRPEKLSSIKRFDRYRIDGGAAYAYRRVFIENSDCRKEGFPDLTGKEFTKMFCREMGAKPDEVVQRIEFEYLDGKQGT